MYHVILLRQEQKRLYMNGAENSEVGRGDMRKKHFLSCRFYIPHTSHNVLQWLVMVGNWKSGVDLRAGELSHYTCWMKTHTRKNK